MWNMVFQLNKSAESFHSCKQTFQTIVTSNMKNVELFKQILTFQLWRQEVNPQPYKFILHALLSFSPVLQWFASSIFFFIVM